MPRYLIKLIVLVASLFFFYQEQKKTTTTSHEPQQTQTKSKNYLYKKSSFHWVSPEGLHYKGKDSRGLSRVDHVKRHCQNIKNRRGAHGVFTSCSNLFEMLDQGWLKVKNRYFKSNRHRQDFVIPFKRKIGYLGGQAGARKRHPALYRLKIVLEGKPPRVITAYPY